MSNPKCIYTAANWLVYTNEDEIKAAVPRNIKEFHA